MARILVANNTDSEKSEVCRYLGYEKERNLGGAMSSLIDSQIFEACKLIQPSYPCLIKEVENVEASRISITGTNIVSSSNIIVRRILSKCHKVAIFLTIINNTIKSSVYF